MALGTCIGLGQEPLDIFEEQADRSTFELNNEVLQDVVLLQKYEKINLNLVSSEELAALQILSDDQIKSFYDHKQKYGKLLSIYELKCIPNFDDETIKSLLPRIHLYDLGLYHSGLDFINEAMTAESHYLMARLERTLETQKGYDQHASPNSQYLGNPYKYYMRYHLNHREHMSMGFTMEKDPGENVVWDHSQRTYGFDHIVGHIQIHNKGLLKRLIVGNFTIATGQGLVFANGMYVAKSAEPVLFVKRNHIGLIPFKSILESGYFQGLGATFTRKNLELTIFGSIKRADSQLREDTSILNEEYANSIYNTGLHRTRKEYDSKNKVSVQDLGYNLRWSSSKFTLGHSTSYTTFQNPQTNTSIDVFPKTTLYNPHAFRGSTNWVSSLDFSYNYRNFNAFGEYARQHKGQGYVLGLQLALGRQLDFAFLYRNYNAFFNSFYANGFAEYFNNNDEEGCYFGLKFTPHKKWTFTGYYDLFSNKQLKYRQYTPGQGSEYLLSGAYKPHKKMSLFFQLRGEQKSRNKPETDALYSTASAQKQLLAMSFKYEAEKNLSLQTKIYTSAYTQQQSSRGIVLAQDISYKKRKFSLVARCALFDTDYNSRIYLYERDVLYAFSFPAYQGKGIRYYAIVQYNASKHLKIWLKWSQTQYHDRTEIGTSGETIESNEVNDLKVQVQWLLGK